MMADLNDGDIALPMIVIELSVINLPAALPVLSELSSSSSSWWCW